MGLAALLNVLDEFIMRANNEKYPLNLKLREISHKNKRET